MYGTSSIAHIFRLKNDSLRISFWIPDYWTRLPGRVDLWLDAT